AEGFPRQFSDMVRLGLERKVDEAYKLHYLLADCIDMIFEQGNPAGIKEVFKTLGLSENTVRLPLVSADSALATRISDFVKKVIN
ncbi:MAG TPA: dihydrodipicolinate synthase family protein, partial [Flavobacterium sp.]|nr:dihydrodipicolinate synthase family protein [Flavobacterium sp.]